MILPRVQTKKSNKHIFTNHQIVIKNNNFDKNNFKNTKQKYYPCLDNKTHDNYYKII